MALTPLSLKKLTLALCLTLTSGFAFSESITMWHGLTGKHADVLQELCDEYNKDQSKHQLKCINQGSYELLMQKNIAAYRSKTHPELVLNFDAGTLDMMISGGTLDIQKLAKKLGYTYDKNAFIPAIGSFYESSEGTQYAQPFNASTIVLMMNAEALKKAGIDTPPETWEQFYTVLQKLKASGHECPFATDAHPWRYLEQYSAVSGEPVATNGNGYDSLDNQYQFNKTSHPRIMNDLKKWHDEGLVKLNAETKAGKHGLAFAASECAIALDSTGGYGGAFTALNDKTDIWVSKMPVYEGTERHNTLVGGAAFFVMNGHSDEKYKATLDFLEYVRSPEVQIEFVKNTGFLPVTQEAFEKITSSELKTDPQFKQVLVGVDSLNQKQNENSKGIRLGFLTQEREIWKEETEKALLGKQSMEDALNNSVSRGNELLQRFARTYKNVQLP